MAALAELNLEEIDQDWAVDSSAFGDVEPRTLGRCTFNIFSYIFWSLFLPSMQHKHVKRRKRLESGSW